MITIIAAMSENRVIGCQGKIPWHISTDLIRFKNLTTGHTVVMGRKTFDSLPDKYRPLPNRKNIIISGTMPEKEGGSVLIVNSLEKALSNSSKEEIFIIGGESIFQQVMPLADKIILTVVKRKYKGDVFFPELDNSWREVKDKTQDFKDHQVLIYQKKDIDLLNLDHARVPAQKNKMAELIKQDICPFCPGNLKKYHDTPIIKTGSYWILTFNDYPYDGSEYHFLLIAKKHWIGIQDISPEAAAELFEICQEVIKGKKIPGGSFLMRFGDSNLTGATVTHLHAHLVVGSKKNQNSDPIFTLIGFKK